MYTPEKFKNTDLASIARLVKDYPFATVIAKDLDGELFINHLPLLLESAEGDKLILTGHMSRKNPQWEIFLANPEATVIIQGPHAYISPSWYKSGRDVPTWNYAVAHLKGKIEVLQDFKSQVKILKAMSEHFEADFESPWRFSLPDDLKTDHDLTSAIVSFRFVAYDNDIEAKFKLSQNRGEADREGVRIGLSARGDEMSLAVRALME